MVLGIAILLYIGISLGSLLKASIITELNSVKKYAFAMPLFIIFLVFYSVFSDGKIQLKYFSMFFHINLLITLLLQGLALAEKERVVKAVAIKKKPTRYVQQRRWQFRDTLNEVSLAYQGA